MTLGQRMVFDQNNHNSVYNRVMTFKRIAEGEVIDDEIGRLIKSDWEKWSKVAYRELALEKVRREKYPDYPSRMACLYTSRTLEEAKKWADFFRDIGRNVYSIVKLKVEGRTFDGDARNCFDGTEVEADNIEKSVRYWEKDVVNEGPIIETLVDGNILVEEIVIDFKSESSS